MNFPLSLPIAGLYYHYKSYMPNSMNGVIKAEPNNPEDTKAIGIYSDNFGLIGYIPKDYTAIVRTWAESDMPILRCKISLSVEEEYGRYYGNILILANIEDKVLNNPFNGKHVYLCKNGFNLTGFQYIVESCGAKIDNRLSKLTDFVIYEDELTEVASKKFGQEGYHFETLNSIEFIQRAIPLEDRNPLLYGKTVTLSSVSDSLLNEYLRNYILINGGIYRENYSKIKTQVVILKSDHATQVETKAKKDGKTVLNVRDILPELSELLSYREPQSKNLISNDIPLTSSKTTNSNTEIRLNTQIKTAKSSGCIVILILALILYILT